MDYWIDNPLKVKELSEELIQEFTAFRFQSEIEPPKKLFGAPKSPWANKSVAICTPLDAEIVKFALACDYLGATVAVTVPEDEFINEALAAFLVTRGIPTYVFNTEGDIQIQSQLFKKVLGDEPDVIVDYGFILSGFAATMGLASSVKVVLETLLRSAPAWIGSPDPETGLTVKFGQMFLQSKYGDVKLEAIEYCSELDYVIDWWPSFFRDVGNARIRWDELNEEWY